MGELSVIGTGGAETQAPLRNRRFNTQVLTVQIENLTPCLVGRHSFSIDRNPASHDAGTLQLQHLGRI
jgi:hypothetical protein